MRKLQHQSSHHEQHPIQHLGEHKAAEDADHGNIQRRQHDADDDVAMGNLLWRHKVQAAWEERAEERERRV